MVQLPAEWLQQGQPDPRHRPGCDPAAGRPGAATHQAGAAGTSRGKLRSRRTLCCQSETAHFEKPCFRT
eukprot:2130223-Lingulodinium_polyedra.AAC.1